MIRIEQGAQCAVTVCFCSNAPAQALACGCDGLFTGGYGQTLFLPAQEKVHLLVGCGKDTAWNAHTVKELCAVAAKAISNAKIATCVIDTSLFWQAMKEQALQPIVLGLVLGEYRYSVASAVSCAQSKTEYILQGVPETAQTLQELQHALQVARGVLFARDTTNRPGNLLHPMDFTRMTQQFLAGQPIETELLVYGQLKATGLQLIAGIGGSSEYPPNLMILRYRGADSATPPAVLVGKGVTCDTGGYCLKSAGSMAGIKGDMAGAAAVVGVMYALAANKIPVNVSAYLPLCENRISQAALLPGDVVRAYDGTSVEILNTDAEGRLLLADAVAYAAEKEKPSCLVDIATLTGAVYAALGHTVMGVLCDNEALYQSFAAASAATEERHLRFPFGLEHEKMLQSEVADIKNIGGDCCGVITAGIFIRKFAKRIPWLHLDIAGTAWVQTPEYAFEQFGATGSGVAVLYALAKNLK